MRLVDLPHYWLSLNPLDTLDVVNKNSIALLGRPFKSLGKNTPVFDRMRNEMGEVEFEIFIQANLARCKKVKPDAFYPAMLIEEGSLDAYLNSREQIIGLWGNPSLRFNDPLFNHLFPCECKFTEEYFGRYLKNQSADIFDCILYISSTATGEWLVSSLAYHEVDKLNSAAYSKYMASKVKSKRDGWENKLPLQKVLAEAYACITECKKVIGKYDIDKIEVDENSDELLVTLVAPQLYKMIGQSRGTFNFNEGLNQ